MKSTFAVLTLRLCLLILLFQGYRLVAVPSVTDSSTRALSATPIVKQSALFIDDTFRTGLNTVPALFCHWDKSKISNLLFFAGSLSFTYCCVDDRINVLLNDKLPQSTRTAARAISELGNPVFIASSIAILGGLSVIKDSGRLGRASYLAAQSFVISMSLCYAAKHLCGRLRPNFTNHNNLWYGVNWGDNAKRSFYSGHTTAIFSIATVFAFEYKYIGWLSPTLYAVAGSAALSRIVAGDHWVSDIIFAAGISHFISKHVIERHRPIDRKFTVLPALTASGAGVTINF